MAGQALTPDPGLDPADRPAKIVDALQDHVGHRRADGEFPFANLIERRLHFVRHFLDRRELEEAGQTLDGVESPKDRVDGIRIAGLPFEGEQALLDGGQMLARFHDEIGDQFRVLRQRVDGWRARGRQGRGWRAAGAVRESLLKPGQTLLKIRRQGWPGREFSRDAGRSAIAGVARLPPEFRERGQEVLRAAALGFCPRPFDQQPG